MKIFLLSLCLILLSPLNQAYARCEIAPANGGRSSCGTSAPTSRNSNSGNAAAAIVGLGGVLLQGLANSSTNEPSDEEIQRRVDKEWNDELKAPPSAKIKKDIESAKTDAISNPWATSAGSRPSKKDGVKDGAAPFADPKCVTLRQPSKAPIDWDTVDVKNNCNVPIQVRICYYLKGEQNKCSGTSQWSLTSTIAPKGRTQSVTTTKSWPWMAQVYVCDMSGVTKHSKLCLHPK
ncbi:hypothetical protein NOJ28_26565 [Neorhizobium galegae]|uniref:hypothetical protein n=1 Tax=Neorhizobium galegae TaxID=399 RepID=UPI0006220142|nr:hypothetical protein [Neorhizobium galegae]MCQ1769097.1 hypothetical protein [Neorhizobium galegae]MCQ1846262.1 hypothetical protein [Neorhizobium galegae]CDZ38057.1 Hypothetical protein NGAL_HAMBI1146_26810 [Neorhizobium galegae bv. officinalis]